MHLFLSPHYDDAVYSCGGTIHQLTRQGEPVRILTTMGGAPPTPLPDTPIVRDLHQRWNAGDDPTSTRRAEDKAAASILSAQVEHLLDVPDCVYRVDQTTGAAFYPTEEALWRDVHTADWAHPAIVARAKNSLQDVERLYAPLGVGEHVDHLLVRDVALLPAFRDTELWLYAEYPYIEQPDALQHTLQQLPPHLHLQPVAIRLTQADIVAKIKAVKAYASQVSTFWQNETDLEQRVQAALIKNDQPPAEYYYRVMS